MIFVKATEFHVTRGQNLCRAKEAKRQSRKRSRGHTPPLKRKLNCRPASARTSWQEEPRTTKNAMRIVRALLVLALSATSLFPAQTIARPYAPLLSCGRLKGMIYDKGAVVLSTGQFTFDRFVRDQGYCMLGEITEPAWIISKDQTQCFVGYTCGGRPSNYN